MLTFVNPSDKMAVLRLQEFLSGRGPWYRSLWGIGVVLAMEELYEACTAMRQGHLSEGAIRRMISSLQKRVGLDPTFTNAERLFLRQLLQSIPRAEGAAHFGILELSNRISDDYLVRWGRAVTAGKLTVERFARNAGAYLLDTGFSGQYLHDHIKELLRAPEDISLPELCEALQSELSANPKREFEVLLAFTSIPELPNGIPESWLQRSAISAWLTENGFDTSGVRSPVAIILKVQARDPIGAAHAARDEFDRYAARALIATGKPLRRTPMLWVKGIDAPAPMEDASRGVSVKELFRADRVFATEANQSVDAALELLSHLEGSSPPAAIAGGWAAIEGLLADPNDRATAADNLAALVTCSFPRAELTSLSYRAQRQDPGQWLELNEDIPNRERCRIIARRIIEGRLPVMNAAADQAAIARMRKLLANPNPELQTIREAISESFHRLYRQRNLILHGGRLDSVVLAASLRTVSKLAGAGMDRITHGHYVQGLKPLELVAKANLRLIAVSPESSLECVDLLEVN